MFRQITEKLNNSKLKSAAFFLFILSILITNSGCLSFSVRSAIHPNFLENDAAITAAEAVRAKFGSNARVLEVQIREEEFRVKIQDPENPKNVDSYKYAAGFFIKTAPVRLDGLERNLANTLSRLAQIALEKLPAPNARVSNIIIKKKKRWKDETYQTIWAFSIKPEPGLGGKVGFVHFDAEGNIIEVLKWK
jgi:hypothetical protein